ncbi:Protein of unknown function [Pyronema omphalodes CBS 100304]|uniref:Uncharacterized protein n=1 Tax=Pyronema omphalodes (strain CBS 100304) TaxID=1076935 RepID=U4KVX4_PYROM|nr:Protein of unknown function [Pyronema omphalodes CBS 100304]
MYGICSGDGMSSAVQSRPVILMLLGCVKMFTDTSLRA